VWQLTTASAGGPDACHSSALSLRGLSGPHGLDADDPSPEDCSTAHDFERKFSHAQDRRCACTLLRIAELKHPRRSRPERTEVLVRQDELATMVNLSRTTLVQVLRRFERRGLVEQGYRPLRVVDVPGLTAVESGR
jgi:CRP-like cAMP-binding protein